MTIIRKIPWTSQPPPHVGINRGHPICAGLKAVFSFHRGYPYEELTGTVGTLNNNAAVVLTDRGYALQTALASNDIVVFAYNVAWTISTAATHASIVKNRKGLTTANEEIFTSEGTDRDAHRIAWLSTEHLTYKAAEFSNITFATHVFEFALHESLGTDPRLWNTVGGTWKANGLITARVNKLAGPNPELEAGTQIFSDNDFVLGGHLTLAKSWDGWILLAVIWDRGLSEGEWNSFVDNPWQIFEPRSVFMPVGVIAEGGSILIASSERGIVRGNFRGVS